MIEFFSATISVFVKDSENQELAEKAFLGFFPYDLKKEKLALKKTKFVDLDDEKTTVLELTITKKRHIGPFFTVLIGRIDQKQKSILLKQLESRLDEDLFFYMRFDKDMLIKNNIYEITQGGNCFHIKMLIKIFPKKRDIALNLLRDVITP